MLLFLERENLKMELLYLNFFSWIKDNNFKIIGEYANIIFNPEGISVKSKKDVPYEIKVLIE